MVMSKENKTAILEEYRTHDSDTGSAPVQIALLTKRINGLREHFNLHRKDQHSRLGLLRMVGKRRRLLTYLRRKNSETYKSVIQSLGLRK